MVSTSSVNLGKKRMCPGKVEDVDEELLTWFKQARALEAPINGPILMEKAGELGKELGISFVPCSGWLGRFKRRHGIVFKAASGEAASVDMSSVDTWRALLYSSYCRITMRMIFLTPMKRAFFTNAFQTRP
ncbi:tigger transposable element-derived protein 6 [Plakobranchus ocellatus]|uniref:Tigger transposable element-derived protein 6 n=1 Tax=Plakobranchus ocellatus TaxID=259542 RepID=A0AAV4CB29_9GAST|nr:tigger transposable element-derived protein 6 [Plakobranchus ocellatus]